MTPPTVPTPTAVWQETTGAGAALAAVILAPQKTAAGYWIFLPPAPLGNPNTIGAVVASGAGYDLLLTSITTGKRITRAPSAAVLIY